MSHRLRTTPTPTEGQGVSRTRGRHGTARGRGHKKGSRNTGTKKLVGCGGRWDAALQTRTQRRTPAAEQSDPYKGTKSQSAHDRGCRGNDHNDAQQPRSPFADSMQRVAQTTVLQQYDAVAKGKKKRVNNYELPKVGESLGRPTTHGKSTMPAAAKHEPSDESRPNRQVK